MAGSGTTGPRPAGDAAPGLDRASSKHGPHVDEEMAREVRGHLGSGASPRAEEWHDPEPAGEDQPGTDWVPNASPAGGTPLGMTEEDVAGRSRLASYLRPSIFPADRAALIATAEAEHAPDDVLSELDRVPAGQVFPNVSQVWSALGHGHENDRAGH